jgi:hypothetical protein
MEKHHQWCHIAACAFAKHHLCSCVQFILESGEFSPTTTFDAARDMVQAYLDTTNVIANNVNSLMALTHTAWTGMLRSSHSVDQWVWEDVIEGWSYDRASTPTCNLGLRRFGGRLLSPKITEVKDTTTEVDWLPVQFEPTAIIGRKRRTPGEGPAIKNDNDKSLWKTTWRQVVRPVDELPEWQREATRRDVQRLHRLPNGSLLVVFQSGSTVFRQ